MALENRRADIIKLREDSRPAVFARLEFSQRGQQYGNRIQPANRTIARFAWLDSRLLGLTQDDASAKLFEWKECYRVIEKIRLEGQSLHLSRRLHYPVPGSVEKISADSDYAIFGETSVRSDEYVRE